MTLGRSLRLFLVDGTPNGLLTAEIMNWTGHVLTGPRSKLAELIQRPECSRTGVYFLVGPDPENSLRSLVYIGESDDVAKRLKQHNQPEDKGGKDFWERVCLVTSKDQNLTKAHVKHLESLLLGIAGRLGHCVLVNGTAHEYGRSLPESDRADMAFFLEQIRTVLPVLGLEFLRERISPSAAPSADTAPLQRSPRFVRKVPKETAVAHAQEVDGEFFVLKGSHARGQWIGTPGGYDQLYQQLVADGVLVPSAQPGLLVFAQDYGFSSPSAGASIVDGRSANGRTSWQVDGTGVIYAEWQSQQVNAVADSDP